jgi:Zn-dependent protease
VFDLNELVPKLILVAFFLLVGFPVHEFAHAFVAYRLGDGTAKLFGRLTLDPRAHFDPIGGMMVALTALLPGGLILGWAKPTPVNPANLRDRRNGEVWVSLAGPLSNLLMAAVGALVLRGVFGGDVAMSARAMDLLSLFVLYNVGLAVFNLIPIPPLDGSALLFRLLPYELAWKVRPFLSQYGLILLFAFILLGDALMSALIGVVLDVLFAGV